MPRAFDRTKNWEHVPSRDASPFPYMVCWVMKVKTLQWADPLVSDILQMCKDFVFQNEFSAGTGDSA